MKEKWFVYVNGFSDLGSRMQLIALTGLVLTFENSAFWLSAFFAAKQVGGVIASFFSGVLVDRVDRRQLMIVSNLICALAVASVLLAPNPWVLIGSSIVVGVWDSIFQVAYGASIPSIFGQGRVLQTNALVVRLTAAAGIAGSIAGGLLFDRWGYQTAVVLNACYFLFSMLVLTQLRWNSAPEPMEQRQPMRKDVQEAVSYIGKRPLFWVPSILILVNALGTTAWNYGLPTLSSLADSNQSTMQGIMWSMVGLGSFVGSFLTPRWRVPILPAFLMSLVAGAVLFTGVFMTNTIVVILVLLFLAGLVDAGVQTFHRTIMQGSDNIIRGRVLSVQALTKRIGYLAGFALIPWLTHFFSLLGMVTLMNGIVIVTVALLAFKSRPILSQSSQFEI